jgi:hypothetical protein
LREAEAGAIGDGGAFDAISRNAPFLLFAQGIHKAIVLVNSRAAGGARIVSEGWTSLQA